MKRLFVAFLLSFSLLLTAAPAASANHSPSCTEVWIHFRPGFCTDEHDGYKWIWVCPDGTSNIYRCFLVYGPMN